MIAQKLWIASSLLFSIALTSSVATRAETKNGWTESKVFTKVVSSNNVDHNLCMYKLSREGKYGVTSLIFVLGDRVRSNDSGKSGDNPEDSIEGVAKEKVVRLVFYSNYASTIYPHPIYRFCLTESADNGVVSILMTRSISRHVDFVLFLADLKKSIGKYPSDFKPSDRTSWPKATKIISRHKKDMIKGLCGVGRIKAVYSDSSLFVRADRVHTDCPSVYLQYNFEKNTWKTITNKKVIKSINKKLSDKTDKKDTEN